MKKIIPALLVLTLLLTLCSCGTSIDAIELEQTELTLNAGDEIQLTYELSPTDSNAKISWESSDKSVAKVNNDGVIKAIDRGTATITATAGKVSAACAVTVTNEVSETEYIKIEGLYVDKSYKNEDSDSLTMVYLFYTVNAVENNLSIDSVNTNLKINDTNTYTSENHPGKCKFMSSYYYEKYLEDVYIGDSLKVVETFEVPMKDLESGKTLTIENNSVPDMDKILLSTDSIIFCESVEEVAEKADSEGYKNELYKRKDADEATCKKVESLINGYEWSFYVNYTTYNLCFSAPSNFELSTSLGTRKGGTYSIKNGYIFCTYPDTQYTVEIPYEFKDGDIELDTCSAFGV